MRALPLFAGAMLLAAGVQPAHAAFTTSIADTTLDVSYWGASPTSYFGGADTGDVIGAGFDTQKIVVTETPLSHGRLTLDFKVYTEFSGTDCFGDVCARTADLFVRPGDAGYSSSPFTYAIALGQQSPNGGEADPGLYSVEEYETSQRIWSSRTGFIYGGAYTNEAASDPAGPAPTVLTKGTKLAGAAVSQSAGPAGTYIEDVSLAVGPQQASLFENGFDLLWGTADCANDTVFGHVAAVDPPGRVPEPTGIAVLAAGFAGLLGLRRARSRASAARSPSAQARR